MIKEKEQRLRFLKLKSKAFKYLQDYEEEEEANKITKKCLKDIDAFDTRIRKIEELTRETIENNASILGNSLEKSLEKSFNKKNIKHGKKIKWIRNMKKIIDTIKRVIFDNVTLELCDIYDLELESDLKK